MATRRRRHRDPRLRRRPLTVNEKLRDRSIRHAIFVHRFAGGEAARVLRFLDEQVYPDVVERLERGLARMRDASFVTLAQIRRSRRFVTMMRQVDNALQRGFGESRAQLTESLREFAGAEAAFGVGAINQSVGFELATGLPGAEQLREIVMRRPFQGRLLREWYGTLDGATRLGLRRAVQIGMAEGESTDEIVRRVRGTRAAGFRDGVLATSRRQAEAVVRTAVNHVSNHAREATYAENPQLIEAIQWVATLDLRTTQVCADRDGKTWPLARGPRPPAHINCRSTTVPVLRSFEELGLGGVARDLPPGLRDAMNGRVSARLTYPEWLAQQSLADQEKVLGRTRARLFRDGKVSFDKFVDDRGRTLTLRELQQVEGLNDNALALARRG